MSSNNQALGSNASDENAAVVISDCGAAAARTQSISPLNAVANTENKW